MSSELHPSTAPDLATESPAVQELVAKQQLYDNIALYCRGQDRKDLELVKSTFWPDATDNHGAFVGSAHEFCEWAYENQKTSRHRSHHYITNVLVELDGEHARRETAFNFVMVTSEGTTKVSGGRYRDLCERRDGEWKVLRRLVIHDHVAEFPSSDDFDGILGGMPDSAPRGGLYPDDPIYEASW